MLSRFGKSNPLRPRSNALRDANWRPTTNRLTTNDVPQVNDYPAALISTPNASRSSCPPTTRRRRSENSPISLISGFQGPSTTPHLSALRRFNGDILLRRPVCTRPFSFSIKRSQSERSLIVRFRVNEASTLVKHASRWVAMITIVNSFTPIANYR